MTSQERSAIAALSETGRQPPATERATANTNGNQTSRCAAARNTETRRNTGNPRSEAMPWRMAVRDGMEFITAIPDLYAAGATARAICHRHQKLAARNITWPASAIQAIR